MKKIIAFYGTILLKLEDDLAKELDEIWEQGENATEGFYEPYYEKVLTLQNKIFETLDEKSNIKNVRWHESPSKEHFEPFLNYLDPDEQYLMRFSSPIMFDVKLPLSDRIYMMSSEKSVKYIQEYSVIYNGTVFLAYAYIDDVLSDTFEIGPEIRESLKKVLSNAIWEAKIMPPCPIRMSFFVQSFEEANLEESLTRELDFVFDDAKYKDINEVEEIMVDLFYRNEYEIADFCSLMSLKHKNEKLTWEINEIFEEVQEKFRIMNQDKYSKKKNTALRKVIFEIYQKMYEYDKTLFEYNSNKERLMMMISDDLVSPYIKEYIISELPISEYKQSNILNSLSYIEDRISENRTISSSISAALIGGFAGLITSAIILIIEKLI